MDRSVSSKPDHSTAMRFTGSAAFQLLLSAKTRDHTKSASAPPARSVVSKTPILRQPQDGRRTEGESKTHSATHAYPGNRSALSKTESKPPGTRSPNLSVPVARRGDPPTQPRVEHRY